MIQKLIFISILLSLFGCNKPEVKKPVEYTGPLREAEKVETYHSENDKIKIKMKADLVYEFQNGDKEFPKGIYLEFYNPLGNLESVLKANNAYYFKEENKWRGRGNVEVKNVIKNEQLNTEELFWEQTKQKILTDKFVTIRQEGDVIYGVGLEAKQDLSDYTILNPTGEIEVEE